MSRNTMMWLQDPLIREATASEELTLEEEYEMQRESILWYHDVVV